MNSNVQLTQNVQKVRFVEKKWNNAEDVKWIYHVNAWWLHAILIIYIGIHYLVR